MRTVPSRNRFTRGKWLGWHGQLDVGQFHISQGGRVKHLGEISIDSLFVVTCGSHRHSCDFGRLHIGLVPMLFPWFVLTERANCNAKSNSVTRAARRSPVFARFRDSFLTAQTYLELEHIFKHT